MKKPLTDSQGHPVNETMAVTVSTPQRKRIEQLVNLSTVPGMNKSRWIREAIEQRFASMDVATKGAPL